MLSALSFTASSVINYAAGFVPRPISTAANSVSEVALSALSYFSSAKETTSSLPTFRPARSVAFYQEFKRQAETPYEKANLLKQLRAKPKVSKACLLADYLDLLPPTKITHKIYDKLKSKWGYRQFYRTLDTGSKGLACAFLMHVLLEDSIKPAGLVHERVVSFYNATLLAKKYPHLQDNLKPMLDALQKGHAFINGITSSDPCLFLDVLSETLVLNFFEKTGFTEDLTFINFIESQADATLKQKIKATLAALGDYPTAPLVPLLGEKQSFFGHNPLVKYTFIIDHLPIVLGKVKTLLKVHIDNTAVQEWLDKLEPLKLLTAFDEDPVGMAKKDQLKPRMLALFKEELIKLLTPNASLFLEGFSFSKRATQFTHFETLADELVSLDGAYLQKLITIAPVQLFELARALESFEDEILIRQVRFINHLSDLFNVSFVVHSWQISQQDKKRLKIQHIGRWYGPTCHIVLFPENNTSRVDLLKQHGVYASRNEMTDLIRSASFKKYKRHGSETLAHLAEAQAANTPPDKLLAKHFLYYRIHIFACLQKLLHQKLPMLKDPARFDVYGNKEDDSSLYNPFGQDHQELLPNFHTEVEANMFRIEKHLSGLNREIAELAYLTDCVFSHTKHEEIVSEIQLLLKAAKKATFQFYLKKIPDFIAGFRSIIATMKEHSTTKYGELKLKQEEFCSANPTKEEEFARIFSKPNFENVTAAEIISLIPRLHLENSPPDVFYDFGKLKKLIEQYQEALAINQGEFERDVVALMASIKKDEARFLAFYPDRATTFHTVYDFPRPLEVPHELVDLLIPDDKLQHADLQKIVTQMTQLSAKIKKLKFKKTQLSSENQAAIETLRTLIVSKRAQFVAVNPKKSAHFDIILQETHPWDINRVELMNLKIVPKDALEDRPIFAELKTFLQLLQKHSGFKKEESKLSEKFAALQAKNFANFDEIDIFEDTDEIFPEAGSLGAHEGETASLGGASYSSELRSVGSVEKWVSSLLL